MSNIKENLLHCGYCGKVLKQTEIEYGYVGLVIQIVLCQDTLNIVKQTIEEDLQ